MTTSPTPRQPLALDSDFRAAAIAVLNQYRGNGHIFSGGTGVSCYVWIVGPSNRPGERIRVLLGGYDLDLRGDLRAALRAIPGCGEVTINVD
jgi:hypothetical protein